MGEIITPCAYGIECELGQIATMSHKAGDSSRKYYDSGIDFFEDTASRERFKSIRFEELMLDLSTSESTRRAAHFMNRFRHEDKGISPTTLRNTVEREGMALQARMEQKCKLTLLENGFDKDGTLPGTKAFTVDEGQHIEQAEIENAAIELNIWEYNTSDYESPDQAVNISIDDVGVKRQTEMRPSDEEKEQPKRVSNTVIHVQFGKKTYTLNTACVISGLRMLIGFLLFNGLMKKQMVIFADGARDINNAVIKMLGFANIKIILDWYHLEKKFKEQLSMALRGSKIRNEFLDELRPCLWFGNVRGAIKLLKSIDPKKVRDFSKLDYLIGYLERVQHTIPCYALRKQLGLRNSSNVGEKANDMIVSNRQKHNGMSWSNNGSMAFATISATLRNGEIHRWLHQRDIGFTLFDNAA